jgi:hypothetical protein
MKGLNFASTLIVAVVSISAISATSHAGQVKCAGDYLFYHFEVSGRTSGNQMTGKMNLLVTQGSSVVRQGAVPVSSSDIQLGRSLQFEGADASGGGRVEATYDARSRAYNGSLVVSSSEGGATVSVVCTAN